MRMDGGRGTLLGKLVQLRGIVQGVHHDAAKVVSMCVKVSHIECD